MTYLALATDYDGTLATEGAVDAATVAALERWRDAGRQLILVTGRMMADWLAIFPKYAPIDLFDWVVTENGAVLYHPASQTMQLLTAPPPIEFIEQLRQRIGDGSKITQTAAGEFSRLLQSGQLDPLSVGEVIVATWQPYDLETQVLIQDMNLDLQVILNKRAVMVLPTGVDKASGLQSALQKMQVSADQTVGVGDAENDSHFLDICGYSVAVANALPMLKERVDTVTTGARGAGVTELIDRLLQESS